MNFDGFGMGYSISNDTTAWTASGNTATNLSASFTTTPRRPAVPIRLSECVVVRRGKNLATWIVINGHYYKRVTRRGDRHYYRYQP